MNILLIGNGFDLAHGLPTGYIDFLGFCKMLNIVYSDESSNPEELWEKLDIKLKIEENTHLLKLKFIELYTIAREEIDKDKAGKRVTTSTKYDELYECIENNIWIMYFLNNPLYQKENWIDFESEISNVVQNMEQISKEVPLGTVTNISEENRTIFARVFAMQERPFKMTETREEFDKCVATLIIDLNRLTRAMEIYFCEYVEKIKVLKRTPDIKDLDIQYVISLNYTNTFLKLYGFKHRADVKEKDLYDFVHGKASISNSIETNNMVLGIDEYLSEDKKNKEIEFITFKKYYQRIFKGTGCKYKVWVDWIRESRKKIEIQLREQYPTQIPFNKFATTSRHNLYIFGHSLDVTDKDLLRDLMLNDNVYTTIFYPDKKELGKKIANLVKVIGQDELIRRTGGSTQNIKFRLQKNMVEITK